MSYKKLIIHNSSFIFHNIIKNLNIMAKEVGSWICMPKSDYNKLKTKAAATVGSVLRKKKKTVAKRKKRR